MTYTIEHLRILRNVREHGQGLHVDWTRNKKADTALLIANGAIDLQRNLLFITKEGEALYTELESERVKGNLDMKP